jgi:CheY-like chemotaxis protein
MKKAGKTSIKPSSLLPLRLGGTAPGSLVFGYGNFSGIWTFGFETFTSVQGKGRMRNALLTFFMLCSLCGLLAADTEVPQKGKAPLDPGLITRLRQQEEARRKQAENDAELTIPDIDAAQRDLENLNNSVNNALQKAQQNRQAEESSRGVFESVVIAAALLGGGIFFFRKFGPRPGFLFDESSAGADGYTNRAEEKSFSVFAASFKVGPKPQYASEFPNNSSPSFLTCDAPLPSPIKVFFESAPRIIAVLRSLIHDITRAPDNDTRRKLLTTLGEKIHALKGLAGLPEVLPVWQLSAALEGLVKQLSDKDRNVTPSTLRTVASAVDLLETLSAPGVRSDLLSNPPIRLLAVDDDALSRHAVSFALKKALNKPDLAENGEAALALASHIKYDAVFLDIQMPGMNGFEVCSKIHGTELNHDTPVVFVTCQSDFDSRAKSTLSGGIDLIGKPFLTFEITVKAVTLTLRGRLKPVTDPIAHPADKTAPNPVRGVSDNVSPTPRFSEVAATVAAPATALTISSLDLQESGPAHKSREERRRNRRKIAQIRQGKKERRRDRPGGKNPGDTLNISSDAVANAFFAHGPANIEMLQDRIEHIYEATDDAFRQEIIVELYLAVHSLAAEASLAKLHTIFQLSSSVEALLKRCVEDGTRPSSGAATSGQACGLESCSTAFGQSGSTMVSLSTVAAAFELLHDLCDAKLTANLTERPFHILITSDDSLARKDLQDRIQLPSAKIESLETNQALKVAAKQHFDAIFFVVQKPSVENLAACSTLRQDCSAKTPIVFVSDAADSDALLEVQSAGNRLVPSSSSPVELTLAALTSALFVRFDQLMPADESETEAQALVPAEK